jgi:uncharacterized sulfatase
VRIQRYLYMRNFQPHLIYGQRIDYMFQTPTTALWKRLYDQGELKPPQTAFWEPKPPEELYDLETDPDEVRNLIDSPAHSAILAELQGALREQVLATRDLGFLTEAELHARAGGSAPRLVGQNEKAYNLRSILRTAELAAGFKPAALDLLRGRVQDADSGVRYWAVAGIYMRGRAAVETSRTELRGALEDSSDSVAITAALALARHGSEDEAKLALPQLERRADAARNGAYVSLMAVNALEAVGERGAELRKRLATVATHDPKAPPRANSYVERVVPNWSQ